MAVGAMGRGSRDKIQLSRVAEGDAERNIVPHLNIAQLTTAEKFPARVNGQYKQSNIVDYAMMILDKTAIRNLLYRYVAGYGDGN